MRLVRFKRLMMENYFTKSYEFSHTDNINKAVKQGFSSPDNSWFKGESIDFVQKSF